MCDNTHKLTEGLIGEERGKAGLNDGGARLYQGDAGEKLGEAGEYRGEVGENAGDMRFIAGEVGEYDGEVGAIRPRSKNREVAYGDEGAIPRGDVGAKGDVRTILLTPCKQSRAILEQSHVSLSTRKKP